MERDGKSPTTSVVETAMDGALRTIDGNLNLFADGFPDDTTVDGHYPLRVRPGMPDGVNVGWTTSFWPGMLWLAHEATGLDKYRSAALAFVRSFEQRLRDEVDLDTHDLGFLYTLACVVPWQLVDDARARDAALLAADYLMKRFLEPAGIIQAWGDLGNPDQRGRTIIDSLMNTPLLFWASEVSGDDRYRAAAIRHVRQLRDHVIRPEGSTFHTFYWDSETGEPLRGATEQGHSDESCWARGQAWGIYGFAINYRLSGDESLLAASQTCADFFIEHLPDDLVPYWDLSLKPADDESRDSSAAAIAATGLVELAQLMPDGERAQGYRRVAAAMLESLAVNYVPRAIEEASPLLVRGVYDAPKSIGVDEGNLWGDYFYLEALVRHQQDDWQTYW